MQSPKHGSKLKLGKTEMHRDGSKSPEKLRRIIQLTENRQLKISVT